MKTIVVGYDGTEAADRALERAGKFGAAFGATVVVTSVSSILTGTARGGGSSDPTDPPEQHEAQLDAARQRLSDAGVEAEVVLGMGDPAEAIVQLAEARDADMIVVGTREPGMIERLFGHSVSASVQRNAHCDVLVVH